MPLAYGHLSRPEKDVKFPGVEVTNSCILPDRHGCWEPISLPV